MPLDSEPETRPPELPPEYLPELTPEYRYKHMPLLWLDILERLEEAGFSYPDNMPEGGRAESQRGKKYHVVLQIPGARISNYMLLMRRSVFYDPFLSTFFGATIRATISQSSNSFGVYISALQGNRTALIY